MKHDSSQPDPESCAFWRSRYAAGLLVMGAVAAYFLLVEHGSHVLGALPFLLLLACPLMHVFMHRGHGKRGGGHTGHGGGNDTSATDTTRADEKAGQP